MNEFDFPEEMPRPSKRQAEDVVLPPDESILSADDLLLGIPEPMTSSAPAEQAAENSDDLLMELPPEAMADVQLEISPAEPEALEAQAAEVAQSFGNDESLELSIQYDHDEPHERSMPTGDGSARLGVLDEQQLEASESDIVDLPSSASADEKPQGFVGKHKPKLVIAAVVLCLVGMKFYQDNKKAELAATAAPQVDPASIQVQSAALEDMQQGEAYVSPLPEDSYALMGDDPSVDAIFGDDLGSMPVDPLPPQAEQVSAQPAEAVASVSPALPEVLNPVPPVPPADPVAKVESAAAEVPSANKVEQTGSSTPVDQAASSDEAAKLKADLARAEVRLKEAEAEIARLKSGAAAPRSSTNKPAAKAPAARPDRETRTVTSAAARSQPAQPAASAKRSDIQYIGSFLNGSTWGAHVVIAGNLYELSAGQRIANLKVDSVTGSGVTINGVNYR